MPAIQVTDLQKIFQSKRKAAGLGGSLRALVRPEYATVEAVRRLSFQMEAGELLGFIGPNGAGKSTTIKMLTGILLPSGGEARVLDYTPWKQRSELAYHIGTVFGQRPQLWYHLPAVDTFILFGKIYELDDGETKQRIRDAIRHMAQEENVGVLLTSHDAGDLEALCKRVIIINHGQIVYEDKVSNLKRRFLTSKLVEVRYADEVPADFSLDGVEVLKVGHYGVKLHFDTRKTVVDRVMAGLSARGKLVDITISDPPLEEVIAVLGTWALNFLVNGMIGLSAFVAEEVAPFEWIYQKLAFIFGGLLIPLDFYPQWLQKIAFALPFPAMTYGPSRLFVTPEAGLFVSVLGQQAIWILVLGFLLVFAYRRGLAYLTVNGG